MSTLSNLFGFVFASAVTVGIPASALAQEQDPAVVELHSVRILLDGGIEKVEVTFSVNREFACFSLRDQADEVIDLEAICGGGDNFVYIAERAQLLPTLSLNSTLHLRSTFAPVVESGTVRPTGDIVLHSVTEVGSNIETVYSKSFSDCAKLVDDNGGNIMIFANQICEGGVNVTSILDKQTHFSNIAVGQVVRLQPSNRNDMITDAVTVGTPSVAASCVLADTGITLLPGARVSSSEVYSTGDINLLPGSRVSGDVFGRSDLAIARRARIDGSVSLVGLVTGDGRISGNVQENTPVPLQQLIASNVTDGGPDLNVAHGGTATLAPGSYGHVSVAERGRLTLESGGTYKFSSFSFGRLSRLIVDTSGADTRIEVQGDLDLGPLFRTRGPGDTSIDGNKVLFYTNDSAVNLGAGADVDGSITAPNADLHLGVKSRLCGCARAKSLTVGANARVNGN